MYPRPLRGFPVAVRRRSYNHISTPGDLASAAPRRDDWHRDVPTPEGHEPLKIALFKGEMQVGQDGPSCSFVQREGDGDYQATVGGVGGGDVAAVAADGGGGDSKAEAVAAAVSIT